MCGGILASPLSPLFSVVAAVVEESPDKLVSLQLTREQWHHLADILKTQERDLLDVDFGVQTCLSEGKDQIITDPALQRVKEQVQVAWELTAANYLSNGGDSQAKANAAIIKIVGCDAELGATKAKIVQLERYFERDAPLVRVADVDVSPATQPKLVGQAALFAGRDFNPGSLVGPYVGKQQFLRTFHYINGNGNVEDRHSYITYIMLCTCTVVSCVYCTFGPRQDIFTIRIPFTHQLP